MKPILKYPGAKWRVARWLHQYTPRCDRVVDVYGGSGAFCLTLPYTPKHLVYNDLSAELNNLFLVLRDPTTRDQLCTAVSFTLWSRAEYMRVVAPNGRTILTGDPVEDARRFLVATWQANGSGQPGSRTGWRNMGPINTAMEASTWQVWRQLPDRLALAADRLSQMEIEGLPALTVIGRYSTPETLLYCDPPYIRTTVHGTRRKLYQHEMTLTDHTALLDALEAHPGPVMVSGYENNLYTARLQHWRMHQIAARAEGNAARTECLWLNPACVERIGYGPLFAMDGGL